MGPSHVFAYENEDLFLTTGANRYPKTWRLGYRKRQGTARVRPEEGNPLGSHHTERKTCGKENGHCTSEARGVVRRARDEPFCFRAFSSVSEEWRVLPVFAE